MTTKHPIPEAALLQHLALLGKTGSGKTSTAKLIIEYLADRGDRVCILDPIKSDWWGLTSSADGKAPGLPFYILGGPRGNLPLNPTAGAALAGIVSDGSLPLSILDMADFGPGQQARFFIDFAPVLLRKMRGVVYLVLEEAHIFAPKERSGVGDENMAVHWAKMLATAGRSKGIRLILLTQRTQALHNALLGSCDTMIAHRLTAPADQDPVIKWLKGNAPKDVVAQVADSLSSLKTGTGWVCSGEARVFQSMAFPRIHTYDNSATPTGNAAVHEVRTAKVDIAKLESIMGAAAEEAKANDPKELRAEITRLKSALAAKAPGNTPEENLAIYDDAFEKGRTFGFKEGWSAGAKKTFAFAMDLAQEKLASMELDEASLAFEGALGSTAPVQRHPDRRNDTIRFSLPAPILKPRSQGLSTMVAAQNGAEKLGRGERIVLTAIAQAVGHDATREELTVVTGYKKSARDTYIQRLSQRGFILVMSDHLKATGEGIAALGSDFKPLPRGRALYDHWMSQLGQGERRVLEFVYGSRSSTTTRDAISEATGYKKSARDTYIQRLSARRLVETIPGGEVRANPILF